MPNHKFTVTFDNAVMDGDAAAAQMTNDLLTATGQGGAQVNHNRDATGKLISLDLELPDAASDNAVAALDANPGIVNRTPALPEGLLMYDLTAMNGGVGQSYASAEPGARAPSQRWNLACVDADLTIGGDLPGFYEDRNGDGTLTFEDGELNTVVGADHCIMRFVALWATDANGDGVSGDFTIAGGGGNIVTQLTYLDAPGGAPINLDVKLLANLVIPKPTSRPANLERVAQTALLWITRDGSVYPAFLPPATPAALTPVSFADAVAAGQL